MSAGVTPSADSLAARVREMIGADENASAGNQLAADDARAALDVLVERLAAAEQALWECYREAGADTDGDVGWHCSPEQARRSAVDAVSELRRDYDSALVESEAAEQDNERLREELTGADAELDRTRDREFAAHVATARAEARVTELERALREIAALDTRDDEAALDIARAVLGSRPHQASAGEAAALTAPADEPSPSSAPAEGSRPHQEPPA